MRIVHNIGTRKDASDTSSGPGIIEALNRPPDNIESPYYKPDELTEDVMIIDTDDPNPNNWTGCSVSWREKYWTVKVCIGIQNGERALLELQEDEEASKRFPIPGSQKAEDQKPGR